MLDEKYNLLLHHAKSLEERLKTLEDQHKANEKHANELCQAMGAFTDTSGVLEVRLRAIYRRVSSIESFIIRSSKRKRRS